MISKDVPEKLKERYLGLHPLIFHRSVERAESVVELFDILETIPTEYPIIWDEKTKRWHHTDDISQVGKFDLLEKLGSK